MSTFRINQSRTSRLRSVAGDMADLMTEFGSSLTWQEWRDWAVAELEAMSVHETRFFRVPSSNVAANGGRTEMIIVRTR